MTDTAETTEEFDYPIKDVLATRLAYLALRKQALALADEFGRHSQDVLPDARTARSERGQQIQQQGEALNSRHSSVPETEMPKPPDSMPVVNRLKR